MDIRHVLFKFAPKTDSFDLIWSTSRVDLWRKSISINNSFDSPPNLSFRVVWRSSLTSKCVSDFIRKSVVKVSTLLHFFIAKVYTAWNEITRNSTERSFQCQSTSVFATDTSADYTLFTCLTTALKVERSNLTNSQSLKWTKKPRNSYQAVRALWIYDRAAVTLEANQQRRKKVFLNMIHMTKQLLFTAAIVKWRCSGWKKILRSFRIAFDHHRRIWSDNFLPIASIIQTVKKFG